MFHYDILRTTRACKVSMQYIIVESFKVQVEAIKTHKPKGSGGKTDNNQAVR